MEPQFTGATADAMVFDQPKETVTIGGRQITIRPLNLAGIKVVLQFARESLNPIFSGYMTYHQAQIAHRKAIAAGEPSNPPNPLWWFGLIEGRLDDLVLLVTHVLQRGDPTLTLDFVRENIEPLVDLQKLLPAIVRQNHLDELLKNILSSQMATMLEQGMEAGIFPKVSTSPTSPSISHGTTESTSSESSTSEAPSPSPNASFSTTDSPAISD